MTTDGVRRSVDTLIFATGFDAINFLAPMHITGLDGQVLSEVWRGGCGGPIRASPFPVSRTFLSCMAPNTNAYNSIIMMIEAQVGYIGRQIGKILRHSAGYRDIRADVTRRYNESHPKQDCWSGLDPKAAATGSRRPPVRSPPTGRIRRCATAGKSAAPKAGHNRVVRTR